MASLLLLLLWFPSGSAENEMGSMYGQPFRTGDRVDLWASKLTSNRAQLPLDYYSSLPFCRPDHGPRIQESPDNIYDAFGQMLTRNHRIYDSPYQVLMLQDMYCEQVCISNLGSEEAKRMKSYNNPTAKAIYNGYSHHWIVDQNLKAASRLEDSQLVSNRYFGGFPVGFVAPLGAIYPSEPIQYTWHQSKKRQDPGSSSKHRAFIYNHVNLILDYHVAGPDKYRVVRFVVEPFSIAHDFKSIVEPEKEDATEAAQYYMPRVVGLFNPIPSCQLAYSKQEINSRPHTSYEMLLESKKGPQLASGKVLFTYDVIWNENPDQEWTNRWDIYMSMDNRIPIGIRWTDLCNGLITAVVATSITITLIKVWVQHQARRGRGRYSRLGGVSSDPSGSARDEEQVVTKNTGADMRRINTGGSDCESDDDDDSSTAEHAWQEDLELFVFAPPKFAPHLLVSFSGLGAQWVVTCLVVLAVAAVGVPVAQVHRTGGGATGGVWAWFLTTTVVAYVVVGGPIGGFVTARMSQLLLLPPPPSLNRPPPPTPSVEENTGGGGDTKDKFCPKDDSVLEDECDPVFCSDPGDRSEEPSDFHVTQRVGFSAALVAGREKINVSQSVWVLLLQAVFPLTVPVSLLGVNVLEMLDQGDERYLKFPVVSYGTLLIINLGILLPLLAIGYLVGMVKKPCRIAAAAHAANRSPESSYQEEEITFPHPAPPQLWYAHPAFLAFSGLLSFVVFYNEFRYLLLALWTDYNYGNVFGFLLIAFLVTGALSAVFAMMGTYAMLRHENYKWWWPAFFTGGSIAVFGYIYAMTLFLAYLRLTTWMGFVIYLFGMTWICFAWFVMMGFVGLSASFWFNQRLYNAIKAH